MGLQYNIYAADGYIFANTKWCKKHKKMTETLAHGYSSDSTWQELSNE